MRYSIKLSTTILFLGAILTMSAQDSVPANERQITLGWGISKVTINDRRFSARTFTKVQSQYHFGYQWQSNTTRQSIDIDFSMNQKYDDSSIFDLTFIKPVVSYALQKKSNNLWIGGVMTTTTLLNFPRSQTGHYNNNPISYTISSAIGPKISYVSGGTDSKLRMEADKATSLLAYVIRPAYGHPYPTKFLESGTFTPTRAGMGSALVKSGKLMSLGRFNSIKLVLGISYIVADHVRCGLHITMDHMSVDDHHDIRTTTTDILFTSSYIY